jgi:UDP-4-amino-4,6-dideoxy-N-acetyl-beta-L-altrosamine transaminase
MAIRFPYSRQDITAADIEAVAKSLQGPLITQGPSAGAFEDALAQMFDAKHAIVCNSGTAALHLAYLALDLGPDRGLLTSPITFLATANAARMCDAPVAFADIDHATGNVTTSTIAAALDTCGIPVAAIAPVHVAGRACEMTGLRELASERGIAIVEDACHAPLAGYSDGKGGAFEVGACSHSDAAALSFHAIKHVAMGEGGAVLTNDDEVAHRARLYRNHGMTRNSSEWHEAPEPDAPWYYEMHEIGWNYRACEMQCALGLSQLGRLEESIERRRQIAKRYNNRLSALNHLAPPPHDEGHVWHLYPVAIDFEAIGKTRGQVMKELAAEGVGTQVHYIPVNRQPYYTKLRNSHTPGADSYYSRTLSIPMYPGLSDADVDFIANTIRRVVRG